MSNAGDASRKRPRDEEEPSHQLSKKQLKKIRQKQQRGERVLSTEEYNATNSNLQDAREQLRKKYFAVKHSVPFDVRLINIKDKDPEFYGMLEAGDRIDVQKTDSLYRARAAWLHGFNNKRSFNRKFEQARMICAVLVYAMEAGKQMHPLEAQYLAACIEHNDQEDRDGQTEGDPTFDARNDFVTDWRKSNIDILIYTNRDLKIFKSMKKGLLDALPDVDELTKRWNAVAPSMMASTQAKTPAAWDGGIGGVAPRNAPLEGPEASPFRAGGGKGPVQLGELSGMKPTDRNKMTVSMMSRMMSNEEFEKITGSMRGAVAQDEAEEEDEAAAEDEDRVGQRFGTAQVADESAAIRGWRELQSDYNALALAEEMNDEIRAKLSRLAAAMDLDIKRELLENKLGRMMQEPIDDGAAVDDDGAAVEDDGAAVDDAALPSIFDMKASE